MGEGAVTPRARPGATAARLALYVRHDKKAALAEEPLATVHAVLAEDGKAIVGTWAHHGNERIVAIHTVADLMVMTELLYDQEIRDDGDYVVAHEPDPQEV